MIKLYARFAVTKEKSKMKTLITVISAITLISAFTSCTKVLYSHAQVMERYKTKPQVVSTFGLPTEQRSGEGIEEWLYNYGTISTESNVGISGNATTNSLSVTQFSEYSRFVKFTFDSNGNVLKWQTEGIDNSERVKNTMGTIFAVIGGVALSVLVVVGGSAAVRTY